MHKEDKTEQKLFQVTDRRFWVENKDIADEAVPPGPRYPSFVAELKARTEAAESKLQERIQQLNAENAAVRERLRRQSEQGVAQARAALVREFLEVADNLERALESSQESADCPQLREGVELTLNLFLARLKVLGVEPVSLEGKPFDPNLAEAVGVVAVSTPELDNCVIEEVQKAYVAGEAVLRPARVRVGRYEG
jgi:molecular chaperone GrpE